MNTAILAATKTAPKISANQIRMVLSALSANSSGFFAGTLTICAPITRQLSLVGFISGCGFDWCGDRLLALSQRRGGGETFPATLGFTTEIILCSACVMLRIASFPRLARATEMTDATPLFSGQKLPQDLTGRDVLLYRREDWAIS
jgi:hypothetical protein